MKKLFGLSRPEEVRRQDAPIKKHNELKSFGRFWYQEIRDFLIKILSRISVGGISMVSGVVCLCSGRWLVGPFRTSNKLNKLFYLTRPKLALLKS